MDTSMIARDGKSGGLNGQSLGGLLSRDVPGCSSLQEAPGVQ